MKAFVLKNKYGRYCFIEQGRAFRNKRLCHLLKGIANGLNIVLVSYISMIFQGLLCRHATIPIIRKLNKLALDIKFTANLYPYSLMVYEIYL